ncbi:MAG TPA: metalloregulator ArsR/SmtB family transcription factor [Vicinamibacteria bacterium]|nr:metalloregulator ArsR/SmtB family transcription factor [Vicinamibacteria bacterium]
MELVLQALGSPRRRRILQLVRRRERSAGDIHRTLGGLTFGAVSQNLGLLQRAGLVSVRRQGRSRLYSARPAGLLTLRAWLQSMWDDALARLQRQAEAEEAGAGGGHGGSRGRGRRR